MISLYKILIFALVLAAQANKFLETQIVPDCDSEFASLATGLAQSAIDDPQKLRNIQAILSSCNKAMMQKLAEVSIYFLDKGIFPSHLLQEIRQLAETIRKSKEKKLNELRKAIPASMDPIADEVASIYLNNSLSGNEKVVWATASTLQLSKDQQNTIRRILSQQATESSLTPPVLPILNGSPIEPTGLRSLPNAVKHTVTETPRPKSFEIKKDQLDEQNNLLFSSKPSKPTENTSNLGSYQPNSLMSGQPTKSDLPLYSPRNNRNEQVAPNLFGMPPTIYNGNDPGGRIDDIITKNRRPFSQPPTLSEPIQPAVVNNGRPQSVGDVKHNANMEDADLLKTRSSIWSDAAKLLGETTNLPEKIRQLLRDGAIPNGVLNGNPIAHGMQSYVPTNTFPLPEAARRQQQDADLHLLPTRDDESQRAIVPVNAASGLDRFDTGMGRFDRGGPSNRVVLSASPLEQIPIVAMTGMEPNPPPSSNQHMLPQKTEMKQEMRTYPDYREGLFPLTENYAKQEVPQGRQITPVAGGEVNKNINDQVEGISKNIPLVNPARYANGGTVGLENHPGPPYPAEPRPKQTIGEDLSETDPIGSIPMGRYGKVYPTYPPPPMLIPTTTVISVVKQQGPIPLSDRQNFNGYPSFPSIGMPQDREFQPYRGPEEITGSHLLLHDRTNIRHHGQNRFVKIDLLNE